MYIKFHSGPLKSGDNKGSCGRLMNYLEKEDKEKGREDGDELKGFFNSKRDDLTKEEAQGEVEHSLYKKGLSASKDKFYTVTMSFSQEELQGKGNDELIQFAQENFADMYVGSVFGRSLDPESVQWVGKLEEDRKYKGFDKEVQNGERRSGEEKEGDNRHIHFVVATKTNDDKQISPLGNHKSSKKTGAVISGYDRDHFKYDCEKRFDDYFEHERSREDSVKHNLGAYRPDLNEKFRVTELEKMEKLETQINDRLERLKLDFRFDLEINGFKSIAEEKIERNEKQEVQLKKQEEEVKSKWDRVKDQVKEKVIEPIKEKASKLNDFLKSTNISRSQEDIDKQRENEQEREKDQGRGRDRT